MDPKTDVFDFDGDPRHFGSRIFLKNTRFVGAVCCVDE